MTDAFFSFADPDAVSTAETSGRVKRRGASGAIKVLSVTSEIFPLIKTGGLADVTGSLPKALERLGIETLSLVPGYPSVMRQLRTAPPLLVSMNCWANGPLCSTRGSKASACWFLTALPSMHATVAPTLTLRGLIIPTTGNASQR